MFRFRLKCLPPSSCLKVLFVWMPIISMITTGWFIQEMLNVDFSDMCCLLSWNFKGVHVFYDFSAIIIDLILPKNRILGTFEEEDSGSYFKHSWIASVMNFWWFWTSWKQQKCLLNCFLLSARTLFPLHLFFLQREKKIDKTKYPVRC